MFNHPSEPALSSSQSCLFAAAEVKSGENRGKSQILSCTAPPHYWFPDEKLLTDECFMKLWKVKRNSRFWDGTFALMVTHQECCCGHERAYYNNNDDEDDNKNDNNHYLYYYH